MIIESVLCLALSSISLGKDEIVSRVENLETNKFKVIDFDPEMERLFRLLLEEVGDGLDNL